MRVARRIGIAVVTATLAIGWGLGHAEDPPQGTADTPGAGLLEFLGSSDPATDSKQPNESDDGSWLAYLSQIDIGKVAKASQSQTPQTPGQTKPADKPGG